MNVLLLVLGLLPSVSRSDYQDPEISYMSQDMARKWEEALPTLTEDRRLALLLNRPKVPYNHEVLPRVSQSTLGSFGGDYNYSATGHPVGNITLDPQWRHTAGTKEGDTVMHFMIWPDKGDLLVYREHTQGDGFWLRHTFPVGMVFMEAIFNRVDGHDLCCEIRTWTKVSEGSGNKHWRPNRYVPCRDPEEYVAAVSKHHKDGGLLARLLDKSRFRKERLRFDFPRFESTVFERYAYTDSLPELPQSVVAKVLKNTPFRSTMDKNWADFPDALSCASPTTDYDGQIYPKGYKGAFFPTTSKSCSSCHNDDGKMAFRDIGPGDWYGHVPGDDNIRSWTPIRLTLLRNAEYPVSLDPRIANSPRVKWRK